MRAISSFSFEAGMSTRECRAAIALRIRVSMSAIGSVITLETPRKLARFRPAPHARGRLLSMNGRELPARLDHPGDLPLERQLAEADAAQLELAQVGAGAAAALAARVGARGELRRPLRLRDHGFLRHLFSSLS